MFDVEPEFAYLDLVTCGEILSNYFEYPEEALYDEDARTLFKQITEEMNNGTQVVNRIKSSMRQIKRAYTLTFPPMVRHHYFRYSGT